MRISYRNRPALNYLNTRSLKFRPKAGDEEFIIRFQEAYDAYAVPNAASFQAETVVLSEAFEHAADLSRDRLTGLYVKLGRDGEEPDVSGTFVTKSHTILLSCTRLQKGGSPKLYVFCFQNWGYPDFYWVQPAGNDIESPGGFGGVSSGLQRHIETICLCDCGCGDMMTPEMYFREFVDQILSAAIFRMYAEVEVKNLLPGQKEKAIDCKYFNDTKLPLTFLDSKWFTTLVKSDAFKVRGHFRLQACGEGHKDRKLIWIAEHEKSGYTAPARKLNQ